MTTFFTGTSEITVQTDTVQALINGINEIHTAAVDLVESEATNTDTENTENTENTNAEVLLDILGETLDKLIAAGFYF